MDLLNILHSGILLYIIFGWIANGVSWLAIHIIFCMLVILQWVLNNNRCILTDYQQSTGSLDPNTSFTKSLFPSLSDEQINILSYGVVIVAGSISAYKLYTF